MWIEFRRPKKTERITLVGWIARAGEFDERHDALVEPVCLPGLALGLARIHNQVPIPVIWWCMDQITSRCKKAEIYVVENLDWKTGIQGKPITRNFSSFRAAFEERHYVHAKSINIEYFALQASPW